MKIILQPLLKFNYYWGYYFNSNLGMYFIIKIILQTSPIKFIFFLNRRWGWISLLRIWEFECLNFARERGSPFKTRAWYNTVQFRYLFFGHCVLHLKVVPLFSTSFNERLEGEVALMASVIFLQISLFKLSLPLSQM